MRRMPAPRGQGKAKPRYLLILVVAFFASFKCIAHAGTSAQTTVSSVSQDASAVEHSPPGLRDQLSLLSLWYFVELPWRQLQLPAHKAISTELSIARDGQLGGIVAARVQSAMDTACHALKCTGIKEAESNCPEVIVFKPLPGGFKRIWSERHGQSWPGVEWSILIDSDLVAQLRDEELQALLALQFGKLLLAAEAKLWPLKSLPMLPFAWKILHHSRTGELQAEFKGLLEDWGVLPKPHTFLHRGEPQLKSRKVLESTALSAAPVLVVNQVLQWRAEAVIMAAARLAIVVSGSPHATVEAIGKVQDWQLKAGHIKRLYRWAQSRSGRALLETKRHCEDARVLSRSSFGRGWLVLLLRIILAVFVSWSAIVALRLGPQLSSFTMGMCLTAAALVCLGFTIKNDEGLEVCVGFLAAAIFYFAAVLLSCSQCSRQRLETRRAVVDALVEEVLPRATEAAAGVALLASAAAAARQIPLGQLDTELRTRWALALRSISTKLADLRRLAGASQGMFERQVSAPTRAWPLSAKLELEIRRVLVGETLWMRRALEMEQDVALERALFWWLHDDGDGGCSGSPRLAATAEQVDEWVNTQTLDKLKTPTLSSTLASQELLRAPPIQDMALLQAAAAAMEEQYQQLDGLLKALQQATAKPEETKQWPVLHALRSVWQAGASLREIEGAVAAFLKACDFQDVSTNAWGASAVRRMQGHPTFSAAASTIQHDVQRTSAPSSADLCWASETIAIVLGLVSVLFSVVASVVKACPPLWPEVFAFIAVTTVLLWLRSSLRLPNNWALLEQCLVAMSGRCGQTAAQLRGHDKDYTERLAHLKALVLVQGIQTAQNLDYLTLCVQAEALKNAKAKRDTQSQRQSQRAVPPLGVAWQVSPTAEGSPSSSTEAPEEFTCRCMQLLLAVLPRQGRHGQRLVSTDVDVHRAMEWFDNLARKKDLCPGPTSPQDSNAMQQRLQSLQASLATGQRALWMMYRLYDVRFIAKPAPLQGALTAVMLSQLGPIVLEHRLRLKEGELFTSMLNRPSHDFSVPMNSSRLQGTPDDCMRILGDLDSTSVSNDDGSVDSSSQASGTVRRILQPSDGGGSPASKDSGQVQRALADLDGESDASSVASGLEMEGAGRILAASVKSDGGSSDSASSAGGGSFALQSSMWSGITYSAASSASTVTEDMLTRRRPLLEGYAHALRPLFMTRGDITHLLSKFPHQVLLGGSNCGRQFAAHRELLEELFGSLVVWVKSPERRGRIRLAFGSSFRYSEEPYMLGSVMTTLQFMGDGVQRIGAEVCPVVPEENEDEEWAASECAASAARDATPEQGALEFEEVVVPLTEVSSRELFLAELLQSDQCQLLASLSQGSHSKYGHRALRRRRRTLRHVREATQLLHSVPNDT